MKRTTSAVSTIALTAAIALMSASTFANDRSFEQGDSELETQACYTAVTKGIDAAKTMLADNNIKYSTFKRSVLCNGMSIDRFASKYAQSQASDDVVKVVALSAMDRSKESRFCLDAVTMGEKAARNKHQITDKGIRCNGKSIGNFLRSFEKMKVVTDNSGQTE